MWNFDLPEDILILILVKLPVKSLYRFKSVSKSWNALISSQEFIELHLNQSHVDGKHNVVVFKEDQIRMVEFSITGESLELLDCKIQQLQQSSPAKFFGMRFIREIVGSCNGLLCLRLWDSSHDYKYDFALCNPLTKSSWLLPRYLVDWRFMRESLAGFGYDDVHDDYKVVNVVIVNHPVEKGIYEYEYKVYSLRSNSWSRVRSYMDTDYHAIMRSSLYPNGVLVKCALHWFLKKYPTSGDDQKTTNSILAFDLRTNKHNVLLLPEVLKGKDIYSLRLSVLNGWLTISKDKCWDDQCQDGNFDLWVMKDSWTKITVQNNKEYNFCKLTPMALSMGSKRKLVFYDYKDGTILVYDLVSHQVVKRTFIQGRFCVIYHPFVATLIQPFLLSEQNPLLQRLNLEQVPR